MSKSKNNFCPDCELSKSHHFQTWLDELLNCFLLRRPLSQKTEQKINKIIEKIFLTLKLVSVKENFPLTDLELRTACFIQEAQKKGIKFKALYGPFGFTGHLIAQKDNKIIRLDKLPIADFKNRISSHRVENKTWTKKYLKKGKFPIPAGKDFWFWQKKAALRYALKKIGYPLVVKPRSGSVAQHVTTNIQNLEQLEAAISHAVEYSPVFIIEKFIADSSVHRATVIDFEHVFCVKQVPAQVIGDGKSTLRELINLKNNQPQRNSNSNQKALLHKIVANKTTQNLLKEKNYNFSSIPAVNEIVYLQKDPFLNLGGDLVELTSSIHPDNIKLFKDVAKFFDIRVTGIDFMCQDVSKSWKKQTCAFLELNSAPCIELHHFPSSGKPQNVAEKIVDLFFKYYL